MLRRLIPVVVALASLFAAVGCQSMGAKSAREQALAMLSDSVKAEVNSYLADVENVTALLRNVKTVQTALETAPKLAPYVTRIEEGYRTIRSYDAETIGHVREAFSPELVAAAEGFSGELSRLAESSTFGRIIKPVLDNVKLFE